MACMRCNRDISEKSPEAVTPHWVCGSDGKLCLRINCDCADCRSRPPVYCVWCEKTLRGGTGKPAEPNLCRKCWDKKGALDRLREISGHAG